MKHRVRLFLIVLFLPAMLCLSTCDKPKPQPPEPETPPVVQPEEDPVFSVCVPGAYGVPGGDVVYTPGRIQQSILLYGDCMSFRLLEPAAARVATLSGVPRSLKPSLRFPVHYRLQERGLNRVSESFEVQVIRIREGLVWLRKDDDIFFVVRP